MSDARDTLENRLEQAYCLATYFLTPENSNDLDARIFAGAMWSMQTLLEQGKEAFREMCSTEQPQEAQEAFAAPAGAHLTGDQFDEISIPLGKALSVLELFVDDLPADQANGGYVAQDLIREAQDIARSGRT